MTLTTAATATLGQLQYTVQIRSVSVELALFPGVNRADVSIAAGVAVDATPGTDATVELDGGDGSATVITGIVDHVDRRSDGTAVAITDGGAALARVRPQETYNGMLATQIISKLAQLADVQTGLIVATTQTSAYVADPRRTGLQHIAALADLAGAVAAVGGDGRLTVVPWPTGLPTVAMRFDREFTAFSSSSHRAGHEFSVVGGGGSGAALAPDVWIVNTDAVTNADDPSATSTWRPDPVLRTPTDVDLANKYIAARRASSTKRFRGECWLQPARRPGDVVQVQETEHADQAGPWLLTSVRHELGWDRASSLLIGVSGGETSALLGAAAGALGGLL
ncbi:MAG: contractile injection system protein, VgrG/Pvc8 family [Ilumatobacteraceae bacterium]